MRASAASSGLGDYGMYSKCNFLAPGSAGGSTLSTSAEGGTEGVQHRDWNNLAPSPASRGARTCRYGWLARFSSDPDQASCPRRLLGRVRASRADGGSRRCMGATRLGIRTNLTSASRYQCHVPDWCPRRVLAGALSAERPPVLWRRSTRIRRTPSLPRSGASTASRPSRRTSRSAQVQNWTVEFGAVALERHGGLGPVRSATSAATSGRTQLQQHPHGEPARERVPSTSLKLGDANLTANNAAGGSRTGDRSYWLHSEQGTAATQSRHLPLPTSTGSKDYGNPAAPTRRVVDPWTSTTLASRLAAPNPAPTTAGHRPRPATPPRRTNAANAGCPRTSSCSTPR